MFWRRNWYTSRYFTIQFREHLEVVTKIDQVFSIHPIELIRRNRRDGHSVGALTPMVFMQYPSIFVVNKFCDIAIMKLRYYIRN